jgi:hypothetical protein
MFGARYKLIGMCAEICADESRHTKNDIEYSDAIPGTER